jgi:hypothetical protein
MSYLRITVLGVCAAACVLTSASFADDMKDGSMMMVMPDGKTAMMPMPDKAKMDMMMKKAEMVKDDMMVIVWGNQTYVIKNEKMADGKMLFDFWGLHGVK